MPLLVGMMEGAGPAGKEAAVGAIANLACIRAHQQAILEVGERALLLLLLLYRCTAVRALLPSLLEHAVIARIM